MWKIWRWLFYLCFYILLSFLTIFILLVNKILNIDQLKWIFYIIQIWIIWFWIYLAAINYKELQRKNEVEEEPYIWFVYSPKDGIEIMTISKTSFIVLVELKNFWKFPTYIDNVELKLEDKDSKIMMYHENDREMHIKSNVNLLFQEQTSHISVMIALTPFPLEQLEAFHLSINCKHNNKTKKLSWRFKYSKNGISLDSQYLN